MEARCYQTWARDQLQRSGSAPDAIGARSNSAEVSRHAALHRGHDVAFVGKVDIPHIHLSAMIADGASARVLDRAVGHLPGTALPGQVGNIALAAHRDTFFRRLGELKPGDVIKITDPRAQYSYRVTFTDIVKPNETWVLQYGSAEPSR
jgi:LPXTG-site transpeptidase (sortase) family protein